uniref:non-specific serine/threonine protein kinase n=1 Tax=Peronospora matthiolae TaxID=2874970 RepID=A0AAV1T8I6_9STRA
MEHYHILERIGEGSFGKVYRGRRKYSGHIVALKFVSKQGKSVRDLDNLRQEIRILQQMNHCNIIAIMDSFETNREFCMVTEYAQGELYQVLKDEQSLSECEIRKIAIQLIRALHVLHLNNIIHRDMKPQNILIGSKQQIKLCDFGFARAITHDTSLMKSIKGTPLYMAPELLQEKPYNYTVDLWSLGVILYELAVGKPPFYTERIVQLIQMIVRDEVDYPSTMSAELRSFLQGLLNKDPTKRLKWSEILEHPFVQETPEQLQMRLQIERHARSLPRFFRGNELHKAMVDENEVQSKPSIECLHAFGKWTTCDTSTGEHHSRLPHPCHTANGQPLSADVISKCDPPLYYDSVGRMHSALLENFVGVCDQINREVDTKSVDLSLTNALSLLPSIPNHSLSSGILTRIGLLLHFQYCSLTLKKMYGVFEYEDVLKSNDIIRRFLTGLVIKSEEIIADKEQVSDVIYKSMRCCMLCTAAINNAGIEVAGRLNYHEFCEGDIDVIALVLTKQDDIVAKSHAKTVKWLGSMIDQSRDMTTLLTVVCTSRLIQNLCNILHASLARFPGSESATKEKRLLPYVLLALATLVQPYANCWDPVKLFPMINLVHDDGVPLESNNLQDVKRAHELRVEVHAEVGSQLCDCGASELVELLENEIGARVRPKVGNGDDPDKSDETEDAAATQSIIYCILKILAHACEASSSLSKKLIATKDVFQKHCDTDVLSVVLRGTQSKCLRPIEQHFATELLTFILRQEILSNRQTWRCAQTLFPQFLGARDVVLLSTLCAFFAEVMNTCNVDKSIASIVGDTNASKPHEKEVWNLVVHGAITQRVADAVFRLFNTNIADFVKRSSETHTLTCHNFRAQGVMDSGVVLLLRVAVKALSQAEETKMFLAVLEHSRLWDVFDQMMANGGNNLLSFWGLVSFLKLLRIMLELQYDVAQVRIAVNRHVLPHLINLLDLEHIKCLIFWPEAAGGGSNAVRALVHATIKVLGVSLAHNKSEELLISTHEILYNAKCLPKLLGILQFVCSTESAQFKMSALELPTSFLLHLVTSSKRFASQFVENNGIRVIKECGMLGSRCSSSLIVDTLSIVIQLACTSEANCNYIRTADLFSELGQMLEHPESMVRTKTLDCIGNLCRHSTTFYQRFAIPFADSPASKTILDLIIRGLSEPHGHVRRSACFAIGNAAFHSDDLYHLLRSAIPALVQNLHDDDDKTRADAGRALGNFVRNSNKLCGDLCAYQVPSELLKLAMVETSLPSRQSILFSLGNLCFYPKCVEVFAKAEPNFTKNLEHFYDEVIGDEESRRNIRRIISMIETPDAEGAEV